MNPGHRLLAWVFQGWAKPAAALARRSVTLGVEQLEVRLVPTNGLHEAVFTGETLTSAFGSGTASTVNLTDVATPSSGAFSARFSGSVTPLYSELYTFSTQSSDGVRLWLNGQLLVNDWNDHAATSDSGSISLTAGQSYSLELDYYDNGSDTPTLALSWSSTSQSAQQVPNSRLTAGSPTGVGTPALTNPGSQSNTESTSVSLQIQAAGPDNAPLTYSSTGLPFGLSLNASTGLISGTLAAGDGQTTPYPAVISAVNGSSIATASFGWTVVPAVSVTAVATQSNTEGDSVSLQINASDLSSGVTLTYSASGLPAGLSIDASTGLITGTILDGAATGGPYGSEVDADDGSNSGSVSISWNVAANPIQFVPLPAQSNNEQDAVNLPLSAFDPSSGATLTFSQTGLPGGLTLNASTGLITGTIALGDGNTSTYTPTITANDGSNHNSETLNWFISSAISIGQSGGTVTANVNNEGDSVSLPFSAADATSGATLSYSATGLPGGLSINASTGLISGTVAYGDGNNGGTYSPVITSNDGTDTVHTTLGWLINSAISFTQTGGTFNVNSEGDSVSLQISASDSHSGTTLSYSQSGLPGGLSINASTGLITGTVAYGDGNNGGTYSPTITATDGTDTLSTILNWSVSSAISLPQTADQGSAEGQSVSLALGASDSHGGVTLSYTGSNLPPGLFVDASGVIRGTVQFGASNNGGTYFPTVTVNDGTDSVTENFFWGISSAISPAEMTTQSNTEGDVVNLQVQANDAVSTATLTYGQSNLPTGLTINAATGLIGGTIALGAANTNGGTYTPTISIGDGTDSLTESFAWVVASAVSIVQTPDQTSTEGDSVHVPVVAHDALSGGALTYSAVGLPVGLTLNASTGLITGTVALGAANAGTCVPTVIVKDGASQQSESFHWTVNSALSISQTPGQSNSEGDSVSVQVQANDPTSGATMTYSATGLPGGLTLNASTGLITGTIAVGDGNNGGSYAPVIGVTDGSSRASEQIDWTVNSPITITPTAPQNTPEGASVSLQIHGSDAISGSTLTYSATGLPIGLSMSSTGLISGTIALGAGNTGTYAVAVTAKAGSDSLSANFNWAVYSAISITPTPNQTSTEGASVSLQVHAHDATSGVTLTYSQTGLPTGLSINASTGLIYGTISLGAGNGGGTYAPVISLGDGTSTVAESFNWTVHSAISFGPLADQTNNEGDVVSLSLSATDATSGATLSYSGTGLPPGLSITSSGLIHGTIATGTDLAGAYSGTITVQDGTDSVSQPLLWNVQLPYVWLAPVPAQSNNPGDVVTLGLEVWDRTGGALTYTQTGLPTGLTLNSGTGLITGSIALADTSASPYTATLTITDGTYSNSQTVTWSVSAATLWLESPPTQDNGQGDSINLQIDASAQNSLGLTYSVSGLPPGLSYSTSTGLISGTIPQSDAGAYYPTITVSAGSASISQGFCWAVVAPSVTVEAVPAQQNAQGDAVQLQVYASDQASFSLSYSASGLPAPLAINASTGLISGTIPQSDAGTYHPTVTVTDGTGSNSTTFSWAVVPPIVSIENVPGNLLAQGDNEGDVVKLQVDASDQAGYALTYSASGLPAGVSINSSTGLISGTLTQGDATLGTSPGTYTPTITASDGTGSGSTTFSWTVAVPVILLETPPAQQNSEGDSVALQVNASDQANFSLTYSATGLPAGLTLNSSTGLISGAINLGDAASSPYTPTLTVSDGSGSVSLAFNWDLSAAAVSLAAVADQQNSDLDPVQLQLHASDSDNAASLTYSASGLPPGLSVNSSTGLISGTIGLSADTASPYTPTLTVSDGFNSVSQSLTWNVATPILWLEGVPDQVNDEGDSVQWQVDASASAPGLPLTYSAASLPGGLSINPSTGLISGTITSSPLAITDLSVSASTGSIGESFFWTVDPAEPLLETLPNQDNDVGDAVQLQAYFGGGPAGHTPTYSASGLPGGLSINSGTGLISGTPSAADTTASPYTPTVTVQDGTLSVSTSFAWTISPSVTPTGLLVETVPDQSNRERDVVTLPVYGSDVSSLTPTYSASGLPAGLTIDSSSGLISGTIGLGDAASSPDAATLTVSDGTSTFSEALSWIVAPALALSPLPSTFYNVEGDTVRFQANASDDLNGATLTYSASSLPPGLSINASTGLLSGTITQGDAAGSPYQVTVSVTDGSATASLSGWWSVATPTLVLTAVADQQDTEGDIVQVQVEGADQAPFALTYSASGLPAGLSINSSTGLISGTISAGDAASSPYTPTLTATDGSSSFSTNLSFSWTVASPSVSVATFPNQQNVDGDAVQLQVDASDTVLGITLTYGATGLPGGLSINSSTGLISGTLSTGDYVSSPYTPTVTVSDGTSSATLSLNWSVNTPSLTLDTSNRLAPQNVVGDTVALQVDASAQNQFSLTYSVTGLPAGISINPSTGLISGTVTAADAAGSPYLPNVTVSADGASSSDWFSWVVGYPASLLEHIPDQQNSAGDVVQLQVYGSAQNQASLTYSASHLPASMNINPTTGLISGTLTLADAGSSPYACTVVASAGGTDIPQSFNWSVLNPAVQVEALPNQNDSAGDTINLQVQASDQNHLSLSYSASNLPASLSINPTTGLISGTLTLADMGSSPYDCTVAASAGGTTTSQTFNLTVTSPSLVVETVPNQENETGASVQLQVYASSQNNLSLSYSASNLPAGLSINASTGLISGTPSQLDALLGSFSPTVTVSNGASSVSRALSWQVDPALLNLAPLPRHSNTEGDVVSVALASFAFDSDPGAVLSYSVSGLPQGLSIDPSSGVISGTLAPGAGNNGGSYTPIITLSDGFLSTSGGFNWLVRSAISITQTPHQSGTEAASVSLQVHASDAISGSTLSYSASGLPGGLTINPSSGLISGTLALGDANGGGQYEPTINVTDGTDNASASFRYQVYSAISLAAVAAQSDSEGDSISLSIHAVDGTPSVTLSYSEVGLPQGLSINAGTGLISGTIAWGAANAGGTFAPVVTVSDGTSSASEEIPWTVASAISISSLANQVNTVGDSVSLSVSASDLHSGVTLTYSEVGLPAGLSINPTSGLISGTIAAGTVGSSDAVQLTVTDSTDSASTSLTWTIGPLVQEDTFYTDENTALTVAASVGILAGASAADSLSMSVSLVSDPSDGSVTVNSDGSFTYTPDTGWSGTDTFVVQVTAGSVTSAPITETVEVSQTLPGGSDFDAVATGDFNGDGNPDFVAANYVQNKVYVYLGNGDGTFQQPTSFSVGSTPKALAVGDLGNGFDDIVVANSGDNTVTVLMNNGAGSFTTSQTLTVGTNPVSVALGDFLGNGSLDIAVACEGSNNVYIFLNSGGSFTLDTTLTVGTAPDSVAAGDLNNDGYADLVVANSASNNISVLLSNGDGSFASAVNYAVGTTPTAVVLADFDGDGNLDVAVANGGSNNVSVLMGNGDGTLGTATNYAVGSDPVALGVGDFNGDSSLDLAVMNHGSNNESVLTNTGNGTFSVSQLIGLGESPDSVAVADFNGSGMAYEVVDEEPEIVAPFKSGINPLKGIGFFPSGIAEPNTSGVTLRPATLGQALAQMATAEERQQYENDMAMKLGLTVPVDKNATLFVSGGPIPGMGNENLTRGGFAFYRTLETTPQAGMTSILQVVTKRTIYYNQVGAVDNIRSTRTAYVEGWSIKAVPGNPRLAVGALIDAHSDFFSLDKRTTSRVLKIVTLEIGLGTYKGAGIAGPTATEALLVKPSQDPDAPVELAAQPQIVWKQGTEPFSYTIRYELTSSGDWSLYGPGIVLAGRNNVITDR